ncbi:MAG: 2-amino-3,7-dideoxy-D-threo-hept-6-ulosonate synthase [Anaerolineales bacterium]|nr:2-amino-3,7-dideoxy-D-threo-hept-6-ulosonate synthase [Alphaproteobacteria bacterium]MDP7643146.1 2-amino-3,7-dideoxy-D-threo-hept-6-ulosonate synthase [Anaerolineales bacterium]
MTQDKTRRMRRIFREDGRAVIIAMEHGAFMGVQPGFEKPSEPIKKVIAGGADAIMATVGMAKNFAEELAPAGMILRVDGGISRLGTRAWRGNLIYNAETALRLGADGVVAMGFPGCENENENLKYLTELVAQCMQWGLPLMAEMLPRGFEGGDDARNPEVMRMVMRIGAELGVDLIKTQYTGDKESFQAAVESCFVPVVVLGGSRIEDDTAVLQMVRDAMDAGGRGVAMGRNIWGHEKPERMTEAIVAIVHDDATVEEAAAMLT